MNTRAVPLSISVTKKIEPCLSQITFDPDELLSAAQVAYALRIPGRILSDLRSRDKSLPFIRIEGRVRYRRPDVLCWLKQCQRTVLSMEALSLEVVKGGQDHE